MFLRLPQILAIAVSGSFIAAPLLGEVTKAKEKKSAAESSERDDSTPRKGTPAATPRKKKSTPRPDSDETTPSPKPKPSSGETSKTVPRGTPRATPDPTPSPTGAPTPNPSASASATPSPKPKFAPNATLQPEELVEYEGQPARVKSLISDSLQLTTQNLTYTYGSADPANGGMDCSGTIYHVLRKSGFDDVPRDSSGQYAWTRKAGGFRAVVSRSPDSFEFNELLPGDLLFWTGTYKVDREIPITHVMIYLGVERKTKKRVMFGASDGRSYAGLQRWGVSVFDFKMPRERAEGSEGRGPVFVGYGRIPGLREATLVAAKAEAKQAAANPTQAAAEDASAEATSTPKPQSKMTSKRKSTPKPAAKRKNAEAALQD